MSFAFFFFNDTATTEIYTLSLHDALPISFLVAEQLRLQQVLRHGAAVDGDERLVAARAATMDGARQQLLAAAALAGDRSEEHTSELQSQSNLVCRLLLEKKKKTRLNSNLA